MEQALYEKVKGTLLKNELDEVTSITTSLDIPKLDAAVLKFLIVDKGLGGVIVCADRPSAYYRKLMEANGLPPNVTFVDATKGVGEDAGDSSGADCSNLSSLGIAISEALHKRAGKAGGKFFVLFDALATFALYSDVRALGKFIHDLNIKLRALGAYEIIILEEGDVMLSRVIKPFCDANVYIGSSMERVFADALGGE